MASNEKISTSYLLISLVLFPLLAYRYILLKDFDVYVWVIIEGSVTLLDRHAVYIFLSH